MPTRDDHGLERYNPDTNMMEIGGVGAVPMDIGVKMEKGLFAPRIGLTFRASPTMVVRGGFGITNDPYSLARPMRTNHPVLLNLIVNAPNAFGCGRTDGRRCSAGAECRSRQRDHPDSVERQRHHDPERIQPRLHQVVERRGAEGDQVGLRRRSGVRRDAPDRPTGLPRVELVSDWRWPAGAAVESEVRADGADPARRAGWGHQVRRAAGPTGSTLCQRHTAGRQLHALQGRWGSPGRRGAMASPGS